jgi:hypothetical protein
VKLQLKHTHYLPSGAFVLCAITHKDRLRMTEPTARDGGRSRFDAGFGLVDGFVAIGAVVENILDVVDVRLFSRLRRMVRAGTCMDTVMLLFLRHSLVVRNVSGIGHFCSSVEGGCVAFNQVFTQMAVR